MMMNDAIAMEYKIRELMEFSKYQVLINYKCMHKLEYNSIYDGRNFLKVTSMSKGFTQEKNMHYNKFV